MRQLLDIKNLGQVFTPMSIVKEMLSLRKNRGSVLEPSCGEGIFLSMLEKGAVGIEIDPALINDDRVLSTDFFNYPTTSKFDTIIGNPPYVRYQDIEDPTKSLLDMGLFDKRSNLYLFFIEKCLRHLSKGGELIFITPRDFIKATSAKQLNRLLYSQGSMTHFYDLGDKPIFKGVAPNCAIWRWEKGRKSRRMATKGNFCYSSGQLWFGKDSVSCLGDFFDIKVGAVSGADEVFVNEKRGETEMVCSKTAKDRSTRRVIYNRRDESLYEHKERLLNRRIRKFTEDNWWEWGRQYHDQEGERIYVNGKTRNRSPFFASSVRAYDGSVLALFPKTDIGIGKSLEILNSIAWEDLGFVCDGRYLFTQRSLATAGIEL